MRRQGNKLSALEVARLKKPGRWGDGHGLWLQIGPSGSKSWCFCYKRQGRQHVMGLGPLHCVSLAEARLRARQANQCLADGGDPIAIKHADAQARRLEQLRTTTFAQAAEQFMATDAVQRLASDKHRRQWRTTLSEACKTVGPLPLEQIDSAIMLKTLLPIWQRAPETGSRLRGRLERVFAWALAHKLYQGVNPASLALLRDALPSKPKQKHHAAMGYQDLPAFMARLRERDSVSARALEFTILTAMRTGEVLKAKWSEVDFDAAVWTCPKTKTGKPHRVPLSHRAVEILRSLSATNKLTDLIFPLSNMAMLELLRGAAGNGYTVHGFRSSFRDWCGDRTAWPREVIEHALAHQVGSKTEQSYRRQDALAKRAKLMQAWSDYLEAPASVGDNVTPLRSVSK